ncbi:hypothetical protein J2S09_005390 [Bacillus fengqiuensis]|nr:hypothetical protein [Bacillus fengqiuensis]
MKMEMTREQIIEHGLLVFKSIGASSICEVCIKNGGSCCLGCQSLEDGIGCQRRNTGCTAWLCGLQKFFFIEIGILNTWNDFWKQVPGQYFRDDETPDKVRVKPILNIDHIDKKIGELVAEKLMSYAKNGGNIEKLERYLDVHYKAGDIENIKSNIFRKGV